jgi:hypothetical protein
MKRRGSLSKSYDRRETKHFPIVNYSSFDSSPIITSTMRPMSQLWLLFLQIATAASLPMLLPTELKHATPTISLSPPHFPPHQLSGENPKNEDDNTDEEPFDNAPITPPAALSALTPLTSSYLLSLTNPSKHQSLEHKTQDDRLDALPAKPTSALPHLRKLDSIRYWASLRTDPDRVAKVQEIEPSSTHSIPICPIAKCNDFLAKASNSAYMRVRQPIHIARDYSDLLTVGIVVLFLGVVVVVELVQKMVDL